MITREDIITELQYCYTEKELDVLFDGKDINTVNNSILKETFDKHCDINKTTVTMGYMFKNMQNTDFVISTPDGYQRVGDFYLKGPDIFYSIKTYDNYYTTCTGAHLFETKDNKWTPAAELNVKDQRLLTKGGFNRVKSIKKSKKCETVYDIEVLHENQRYWSGNGISSHNSGKSYLAVSLCRNAQKKGYTPIYLDSESAIDKDFVERLGCDSSKFVIKQVTRISEVSHFIANLTQKMLEMKEEDRPKIMIVLDSLGNLTSDKELTDTVEGNAKRDMTKQQEIKALFRTNVTALGKLGILFVVNSHIYQTQDLFSKTVVSGGCLVPGSMIYTQEGLKDISKVTTEDRVLGYNNTYHNILKTFKYKKPTIKLKLSDGSDIECSEDHKFLVDVNNMVWKSAKELTENDTIYSLGL